MRTFLSLAFYFISSLEMNEIPYSRSYHLHPRFLLKFRRNLEGCWCGTSLPTWGHLFKLSPPEAWQYIFGLRNHQLNFGKIHYLRFLCSAESIMWASMIGLGWRSLVSKISMSTTVFMLNTLRLFHLKGQKSNSKLQSQLKTD